MPLSNPSNGYHMIRIKISKSSFSSNYPVTRMSLKIVVYSKSACPQCESVKMILKSKSLAYDEIKIDDEGERMAFYVGGLAGLQAALAQMAN
jgi:glutaredoxin 3